MRFNQNQTVKTISLRAMVNGTGFEMARASQALLLRLERFWAWLTREVHQWQLWQLWQLWQVKSNEGEAGIDHRNEMIVPAIDDPSWLADSQLSFCGNYLSAGTGNGSSRTGLS